MGAEVQDAPLTGGESEGEGEGEEEPGHGTSLTGGDPGAG
jgi:hypothetical protein